MQPNKGFIKSCLKPVYFFVGLAAGFSLCCFAGKYISEKEHFTHFNRFYNVINPQIYYYPTTNELITTAQHLADPNKILVLIGGSSVFRGTGQNPNEVWSRQLQKELGAKYVVLNYGVDGGTFTSFGAVAFRALIERYQKIIFVSTCTTFASSIEGVDIYRYLFWDAYYKGLFHPDAIEAAHIHELQKKQTLTGMEQHILSRLDSHLHFQNLWNWIAYRIGFSVWSEFSGAHPFQAKRRYEEPKTDLSALRASVLKDKQRFDGEVAMLGKIIEKSVDVTKHPLKINPDALENIHSSYDHAFSPRYRSHILCVFINENPRQLSKLSKDQIKAHDMLSEYAYREVKKLGYHAITVGKDFVPDDYFDGGHLYSSGGKKVAHEVAKAVRKMM